MVGANKQALLDAFCKLYFNSALHTHFDAQMIAICAVSFAYGAGLELPDAFKGFEKERLLLARILAQTAEGM